MLHVTWRCCISLILYTFIVSSQKYAEREPLPADMVPFYDDYVTDDYNFADNADIYRWNVEDFPHPLEKPRYCNRLKASYICDPDSTIDKEKVDDLDEYIHNLYKRTPCICNKCSQKNGGIIIGIALLKYIYQPYNEHPSKTIRGFSESLRSAWKLGQCDNDILIVVATEDRLSYTSVGSSTSEYVSIQTAHSIFLENKAHFTNRHFYEGLKSMLNAYNESMSVMASSMRIEEEVDIAVITGSVIGALILIGIIIFLVIVIRHWSSLKKETQTKTPASNETTDTSQPNGRFKSIKALFHPFSKNKKSKLSSASYDSCKVDDVNDRNDYDEEVIDTTLQICPEFVETPKDDKDFNVTNITAIDDSQAEIQETSPGETDVFIFKPRSLFEQTTSRNNEGHMTKF